MFKISEIRNLSIEEIAEKVEGLKKDLMQHRFQAKTGKLEKQSSIREIRREIARFLTVLNEKKIEVKS